MSTAIHKTNLQFVQRANLPEHPTADWQHDPDMSGVVGVPFKYWKAPASWTPGAGPVQMTQVEKDAVEAAILAARRASVDALLQQNNEVLRAFMVIVLDEFNLHAARFVALLDAIDNNSTLANIRTAVAAIQDISQRTETQLRNAIRDRIGVP